MTWKELLQKYGKTEELALIKEHNINMSTVQEILDKDILIFGGIKINSLTQITKERKALNRVDKLLEIYREGYDITE